MKRLFTLAALLCLVFLNQSVVFAQDIENKTDNKNAILSDVEQEDGLPVEVLKKKTVSHKHIKFGIDAGLNSCYLHRPDALNDAVIGSNFGGFLYIPLAGKVYLQPGLYYAQNGGSQTVGTGNIYTLAITTTYKVSAIEIPVNLGIRFGHKRTKYKSFIGLGAYVARNLGGSVTFDDGVILKKDLVIGSDAGQNFKAFDYGVGLNASFEWRCGLFMSGRFQYGLANLAPHVSTMNSISDGFALGYLFGKKYRPIRRIKGTDENYNYIDPRGRQ